MGEPLACEQALPQVVPVADLNEICDILVGEFVMVAAFGAARKIERELGWKPTETFDTGIRKTVRWYLDNADWVARVQSGAYRDWVDTNYAARAGNGKSA